MPIVVIDHTPAAAEKYVGDHAIVVVDILRFSTTATTAVAMGRRVYPCKTADDAFEVAERFANPLLVGELGGNVPYGFHFTNSPLQMQALASIPCGEFTTSDRPIILVSSSGSQLLMNSVDAVASYVGCLRNATALAEHLASKHDKVAVIGAGTRGVFRREDQVGCAWIAGRLRDRGYECSGEITEQLIDYWNSHDVNTIREGRSAEYLMSTGQILDLEFVLSYLDDLRTVPQLSETGVLVDAVAGAKV